ncbi:hypothetical protein G6F32_016050 [Rhizopus arrhizus]|nr:hypothetical protein G6F32_016050 [Rhizopus arrhizus]
MAVVDALGAGETGPDVGRGCLHIDRGGTEDAQHQRRLHDQQHAGDQCGGYKTGNTCSNTLFKGEFHRVLPVQPKVKA